MTSNELPPWDSCTAERHGTRGAYLVGCRCDTARHAYTRYQKEWNYDRAHGRLRKVPVIGAQRRVQALMRIGWDLATIGRRLGRHRLNLGRYPVITNSLHVRIAALYDELADHRGPSPTTARYAARQGWLPPIAWDDDTIDDPAYTPNLSTLEAAPHRRRHTVSDLVDAIAIERYLDGDRSVKLTAIERHAAAHQLRTAGVNVTGIAQRMHMSGAAVHNLLAVPSTVDDDDTTGTRQNVGGFGYNNGGNYPFSVEGDSKSSQKGGRT